MKDRFPNLCSLLCTLYLYVKKLIICHCQVEVWNNCLVSPIRCGHFVFVFVFFRDEIKYIISTYKVLQAFFFNVGCAFNK